MAKFLLLNFAAPDHMDPVMPLLSELITYGAQVVCALPESRRAAVEQIGASIAPDPAPDGPESAPHDDAALARLPYELGREAAAIVPRLMAIIEQHQPDCILYHGLYLPGALAARFARRRAAALRPFHAPPAPRVLGPPYPSDEIARIGDAAHQALDQLCRAYREPLFSLQEAVSIVEPLNLVFMPRDLQQSEAAFDQRFVFIGACLPAARPPKNYFTDELTNLTRNLYISLGRRHPDDPHFHRLCLEAFESGDWNTVLSAGPLAHIETFAPVSGQFQIVPQVPQLSALAEADVFITHGGLNSVIEALFYGVPVVVIPTTREHRLTARRLRDLGLGAMLEREDLTAETLRQTTRDVVHDQRTRDRVRHMRQVIRDAGGTQRGAEALLDYVAG